MIYRISSITVIVAAFVTAIAGGLQWWSGNKISAKQEVKIAAMEKEARIKKSTIISQTNISKNKLEGKLFVHKYLISINSPVVHIPLYTNIEYNLANGDIKRIGGMQLNDVGGGVRRVEDENVSYVDTEYTVKTDRPLKSGEEFVFSLEEKKN